MSMAVGSTTSTLVLELVISRSSALEMYFLEIDRNY